MPTPDSDLEVKILRDALDSFRDWLDCWRDLMDRRHAAPSGDDEPDEADPRYPPVTDGGPPWSERPIEDVPHLSALAELMREGRPTATELSAAVAQ